VIELAISSRSDLGQLVLHAVVGDAERALRRAEWHKARCPTLSPGVTLLALIRYRGCFFVKGFPHV